MGRRSRDFSSPQAMLRGSDRGGRRSRDYGSLPYTPGVTPLKAETVETRWSERSQVAQDKIGQTERQETADKVANALGDAADAAQKLLGNG